MKLPLAISGASGVGKSTTCARVQSLVDSVVALDCDIFWRRTHLSEEETAQAAAAWVRETFSAAKASNASAVVIAFHGNPFDEEPRYREPFQPFLITLQEEVEQFRSPVLVAHGDDHEFTVDQPLELANLTRLEVPGSPDVGWVRVTVTPSARNPFAFENHVIPRWKYW